MCALAYIVTGAIIFIYNYSAIKYGGAALLGAGLLLAIMTVARNKWITSRNVNLIVRLIELAICVTVAIYSATEHWKFPVVIFGVLSASVAFGLFWERAAGNALLVQIDENGVRLPVTARTRFLKWTEVEHVVLKFGAITINCVDNRLFQWSLGNTGIDSDIIEEYCNSQVEANRSKRRNDDW